MAAGWLCDELLRLIRCIEQSATNAVRDNPVSITMDLK